MAVRAAFEEGDIRALLRGPSDEERAGVAHRLCRRIDAGVSPEEREAAHEILRLMAADAAEVVRRALAVTLKASRELPRDVALRLAADVDSIAVPVLNFSPAFSDEDLADIVRCTAGARQLAVAQRPELGAEATLAIAECGDEAAVQAAVANDNAVFPDAALSAVLDRFGRSRAVTAGMAYRRMLPLGVAERLVNLVGEEVRRHLVDRHQLSPETAMRVAFGARERATLDLVDQAGAAADLPAFCAHLKRQERLSASLVLRALAAGRMSFVEHALAELAGVAHHRAWLLLHDAGPLGLRALYERAELPERLLPAFRAGVDAHRMLVEEGGDPLRFQQMMLERFLTQPAQAAGEVDLEYLLERLDRITAEEAQPATEDREAMRGAA